MEIAENYGKSIENHLQITEIWEIVENMGNVEIKWILLEIAENMGKLHKFMENEENCGELRKLQKFTGIADVPPIWTHGPTDKGFCLLWKDILKAKDILPIVGRYGKGRVKQM